MSRPLLKVCGMTSMAQVEQLVTLGVDYAGFIFYEKSPRYVADKIAPLDLKRLTGIQKVGVFVNETVENILQIVENYGLDAVQLHGDEAPEFCKALLGKIRVIKAFRVKGDEDLSVMLAPYKASVDYFLFDTKAKEYGGTGKQFDWAVLETASINKPYFLSGGIGYDHISQVKDFAAVNEVFAIDVNSKFETAPGIKNMEQVQRFVKGVN